MAYKHFILRTDIPWGTVDHAIRAEDLPAAEKEALEWGATVGAVQVRIIQTGSPLGECKMADVYIPPETRRVRWIGNEPARAA